MKKKRFDGDKRYYGRALEQPPSTDWALICGMVLACLALATALVYMSGR